MNHARSSGSPLTIELGGVKRTLRRLSRRDFGLLTARMPASDADRPYLTPYHVHRWSGTVDGAAAVIALASLPADYEPSQYDARLAEVSDEEVSQWGSIVRQSTVASTIVAESLLTGDESTEDEHGSDPHRRRSTGTTPTKRE